MAWLGQRQARASAQGLPAETGLVAILQVNKANCSSWVRISTDLAANKLNTANPRYLLATSRLRNRSRRSIRSSRCIRQASPTSIPSQEIQHLAVGAVVLLRTTASASLSPSSNQIKAVYSSEENRRNNEIKRINQATNTREITKSITCLSIIE